MDVREFFVRLVRYVILVLWGAAVAAGTTDPNTPDEKYVEFGKQFPSIVQLRARVQCDKPECEIKEHDQFGSAVIIKPHWILTAAHVTINTTKPVVIKDGVEYPLAVILAHKEYNSDNIGYHDIALGYSPTDFKLPFYTPLYNRADERTKSVTISGFGLHGTFLTGCSRSDRVRRAGHNKVEGFERTVLLCTPDVTNKFPLEFIIAPGDSGGGLFIGNELAGINSFLMAKDGKPDGTYGDESAHTRVSLYVNWVNSQIQNYELALQAQATMSSEPALAQPSP
jgi:hypothetical protein